MNSSVRLRVCLYGLAGVLFGPVASAQQQDPRSVIVSSPSSGGTAGKPLPPKRYWADYKGNAIRRANLDGSNAETATEAEGPYGISQDPETGSLLWTSSAREVVQSLPPESREKPVTLVSSFEAPFALTFSDSERDTAYGIEEAQVVRVTRDRYSGVEQRDVLLKLSSPDEVHGLALSADRTVLYLGDSNGRMTQRLNLSSLKRSPLAYSDPEVRAESTPKAKATPKATPAAPRSSTPEKSR